MTRPLLLRPAATPIEWEIIKGDTFRILVPVLDDADAPADLDGWSAKAQVRRAEREPLLHEWSSTAAPTPTITVQPTSLLIHVDGAVTSAWTWTDALMSIEVREPSDGPTHTIAQGPIRALPEITQ